MLPVLVNLGCIKFTRTGLSFRYLLRVTCYSEWATGFQRNAKATFIQAILLKLQLNERFFGLREGHIEEESEI